MANFAILNNDDIVTGVYGVANDKIIDAGGFENEDMGKTIIAGIFGIQDTSRIVQTSYSKTFRGAFAGIGLLYDRERNVFLIPKRFPSWIYDEATSSWVPPKEFPNDGGDYSWDESNLKWIPIGNSDSGATLFKL
jgi:hypothetical protein